MSVREGFGILERMTALTRLHLQDSSVSISELLRTLPQLQQLEVVAMRGLLYQHAPPADFKSKFAALTASSKLKTLELVGCLLPPGALTAMFGGSKQLTAVVRLAFNTEPEQTLGTPELQAIARSCPALRSLVARNCVKPGTDWSALSQLQHLNSLCCSHVSDANAGGLATLVRLDSLNVVPPNSISAVGVQRLTTLRKLTNFAVYSNDSIDCPMAAWAFFNEVGGLSLQMGMVARTFPSTGCSCGVFLPFSGGRQLPSRDLRSADVCVGRQQTTR